MEKDPIHSRASEVALTSAEIAAAREVLSSGPLCVATMQRRLRIGWNRAADLIAHLRGVESLPPVARRLFENEPERAGA